MSQSTSTSMVEQREIINFDGLECYEFQGTVYLKLETVARELGFTRVAASGNEVVRWDRVLKHLMEFKAVPTSGHGGSEPDKPDKDNLPEFIPENVFFRLAMKAKNAVAEAFQAKVADEILPAIRKHGGYVANDDLFVETYLPFADENTKQVFKMQLAHTRELNHQLAIAAPKAEYYDAFVDDRFLTGIRVTAKEVGVKQNQMVSLLLEKGYLYRDNKGFLQPNSTKNRGYFKVKESYNEKTH